MQAPPIAPAKPTETPSPPPVISKFITTYVNYYPTKSKQPKTFKTRASSKLTLASFHSQLRTKFQIAATQGVFIFVNKNKLQTSDKTLQQLYDKYKSNEELWKSSD